MNQSTAFSRRAMANQLQSSQMALLDVLLFSEYVNARSASNETLQRFYADRFRGEAKSAFEAWMATRPFENASAAPHPFVTNFYRPRLLEEARQAEDESQRYFQQAGETGRVSRSYVLLTVVLASALQLQGQLEEQAQHSVAAQLLIGGGISVIALFCIWLMAQRIVAPIRTVVARLKDIASGEGDLTQRIVLQRDDEIGELAKWFNNFLDKLQSTISQVIDTVAGTRASAALAAQGAARTSAGMQAQYQEVDLVATAYHLLGVPEEQTLPDGTGRPVFVRPGMAIEALIA